MKQRILVTVLSLIIMIGGVWYIKNNTDLLMSPTAFAVGDLVVNWGVPDGEPIFTIDNFAPGETATRQVSIINNASSGRPVSIKAIPTNGSEIFAESLLITIHDESHDIYGGSNGEKTLKNFFDESSGANGISLDVLDSTENKNYTIEVRFAPSGGNDLQNTRIVFDLQIGILVDIPQMCSGMKFKGDPIYGTEGNDRIRGGSGNDLIIAFEGNDRIDAGSGDDCVIGGTGNDRIDAGSGDDRVDASDGDNRIDLGSGDDILVSGNGNDRIDAGSGDDEVKSGNGNDVIKGASGSDRLMGEGGHDKIDGDSGRDMCEGEDLRSCER